MDYIDISLPLSQELVTYPGNQPFERTLLKEIDKDDAEVSRITLGSHTGTHIDAPRHFIKGGKSIDQIDPAIFIGPCRVIDCSYVESMIRETDVKDLSIQKGERILLKTQNSDYVTDSDFVPAFISLALDAAQYLANCEVALVGIDYLGIEAKGSAGHPVHKALLKRNVIIMEGLNLKNINPGEYTLTCLPLAIVDGDGSPCRALLTPV